jgi:hypothetical protein
MNTDIRTIRQQTIRQQACNYLCTAADKQRHYQDKGETASVFIVVVVVVVVVVVAVTVTTTGQFFAPSLLWTKPEALILPFPFKKDPNSRNTKGKLLLQLQRLQIVATNLQTSSDQPAADTKHVTVPSSMNLQILAGGNRWPAPRVS